MLSRDEMRVMADLTDQSGELIKDLQCLLETRFLKNILIIDNSEQKAYMHYKNLIPIVDFKGEGNDQHLKSLCEYLKTFKGEKDVRSKVIADFQK